MFVGDEYEEGTGWIDRGVSATLIGDDPTQRTNTNLWPTDHGGVVAKLKVR